MLSLTYVFYLLPLMTVVSYSSLFLILNWNACWFNQKFRQILEYITKGWFSFLKTEEKNGEKTRREAPQKVHKRLQGKILTRLKAHIIKKLNKWFTNAIRKKSEGKLRLRICKNSNKLLNYSWSHFYSCLSGILSGTL